MKPTLARARAPLENPVAHDERVGQPQRIVLDEVGEVEGIVVTARLRCWLHAFRPKFRADSGAVGNRKILAIRYRCGAPIEGEFTD